MLPPWPIAVLVLIAWTIQATTGFGSTVITLTFSGPWMPLQELVPVLALLNLPLTLWTTLRHRSSIDASVCFRLVLPWMLPGMALGLWMTERVDGPWLRKGFGAFVLVFAVIDLLRVARNFSPTPTRHRVLLAPWIVLAGVMHGLYNSGGPALVQAMTRLGLDRAAFRATMSAIWLTFNVLLNGYWLYTGRLNATVAHMALALSPCVPVGIWLGERLHPVLPERGFYALVQGVLVLGGAAMLL